VNFYSSSASADETADILILRGVARLTGASRQSVGGGFIGQLQLRSVLSGDST